MLRFFRQIRQRLLKENRFSKYMLYALGEITLVVIGILIALQINTWNEKRKLRIEEIKLLGELRFDLVQTKEDIEIDRSNFLRSIRSNELILTHMKESLPYHDSLNTHFGGLDFFATFSVNRTTFDNIKQAGYTLITDDSLRIAISSFYTSYVNLYKEMEERVVREHYENYLKPMYISEFHLTTDKGQLRIPNNYESFISNQRNAEILNFTIMRYRGIIGVQKGMIIEINKLIEQIETEIKNE